MIKAEVSASLLQSSVIFRNHSNILICCSRNISEYINVENTCDASYLRKPWKQLLQAVRGQIYVILKVGGGGGHVPRVIYAPGCAHLRARADAASINQAVLKCSCWKHLSSRDQCNLTMLQCAGSAARAVWSRRFGAAQTMHSRKCDHIKYLLTRPKNALQYQIYYVKIFYFGLFYFIGQH